MNLCFPYWEYQPFRLDDLDNSECRADFRVEKEEIPRLAAALQIPDFYRCSQGTVCPGEEGLCLLLRRLSYPCRYHDIIHRFAWPVPEHCMIANKVLDWMYDTHGHRLTTWNNRPFLSPANLERYAIAITRKGSPLTNCFGFIDGTVREISRPGENQRVLYNGKTSSCSKISIRCNSQWTYSKPLPSGLLKDGVMMLECWKNLFNILQREARTPRGEPLCLSGDPAYPLCPQLMGPYRDADVPVVTPEMKAFNTAVSEVRVSVEWLFGDIA